jgi:hypothetical protein
MSVKQYTASQIILSSWINNNKQNNQKTQPKGFRSTKVDMLNPVRNWLNKIQVNNPTLAHRLCQMIPTQCPFERKIELFGHTILNIPPLCKLNPLYNEVVALRFRAICYLADECGEDVSCYC